MSFNKNMNAMMKLITKSHEDIIRSVCTELDVTDENIVNDLIKKLTETQSTKKSKKDPNRIKKPKSAYLFFCDDKRKEVQEKNPEMKMAEISKVLGGMWKELSEEEKQKYNEQREEAVANYNHLKN